jgi:hypothetical protein
MDLYHFQEKWVKLEITMLSKLSQTQKNKYQVFSHAESRCVNTNKQKAMNLNEGLCGCEGIGERTRNSEGVE